ncbi:MAG: cellulose-binding protein [Oscillospiraceae bacterium]|nr:cellulose-binding protein [Oscillospiraceae bacterium]
MKLKKILALGCAVLMTVGCMTSCKKEDEKKKNKSAWENETYYNGEHKDLGYEWGNVEIVGGGFVPAIIYNQSEKDLVYARTDIGGAYKMNKETGRWECITDFVGGEDWNYMGIESIATDPVEPNRVYLAAGTYTSQGNGAIFISEDYGKNWIKAEIETSCGGNEVGRGVGERLMIDPNDNSILYFASRKDGLFKSEDYGRTWKNVESFPTKGGYVEETFSVGLTWVEFDKSSSKKGEATKTIFVGAARGDSDEIIFRSDDAGKTWTALPYPTFENIHQNMKMKPIQAKVSSDGYLYATFGNNVGPNGVSKGAVMKYDIKNNTWEDITPPLTDSCGYSGIDIDANDPQTIVVSTLCLWGFVDNVLVTKDGGATWDGLWKPGTKETQYTLDISDAPWLDWQGQLKLGWWMTDVSINPFNSDEIMYGTGATIFASTNFTKLGTEPVNLTVKCEGLEETAIIDFVSPKGTMEGAPDLYSIMLDIYGFRHDDATVAPNEHFGDFKSTSIDCGMDNYKVVVRATSESFGNGLWYSTDAGDSWQEFETLPDGLTKSEGGQAVVSTDGKSVLFMPGKIGSDAYVTDDFGKTWTKAEGLPSGAKLEADAINPNVFYGVSKSQFYVSYDGGKTFEKNAYFLLPNFQWEANPFAEGEIYISAGSGGMYFLDIEVGEIKPCSDGPTQIAVNSMGLGAPEKEGSTVPTIFAMGGNETDGMGVYRSTDGGKTWKRINDDTQKWGNVNSVIKGDPKTFGRCYISTNGRGIIMGNVKE